MTIAEQNITRVLVTPEDAERMLKINTSNRPVHAANLNYLCDQLLRGYWVFNGESIKINGDMLLDGQHRLMACVKTGVAIDTLLHNGLSNTVFDTLDTGRCRSASDTLSIKGETNTKRLTATLALLYQHEIGFKTKHEKMSPKFAEELLERHPLARVSVKYTGKKMFAREKKLITPAQLSFLHYLFSKDFKDDDRNEKIDGFFEKLYLGINLKKGDAVLLLRNRLFDNGMAITKLPKVTVLALCIKAWNFYMDDATVGVLKYANKESFPTVK